jgi:hypothetical protein
MHLTPRARALAAAQKCDGVWFLALCTCAKVCGFVPPRNLVDFPDRLVPDRFDPHRFDNDGIDPVIRLLNAGRRAPQIDLRPTKGGFGVVLSSGRAPSIVSLYVYLLSVISNCCVALSDFIFSVLTG